MKPETFEKFARALGFNINVEDIKLNGDDEDAPELNVMDDEDEEEEVTAPAYDEKKKKKKVVAQNRDQAPAPVRSAELPEEVRQLKRLVDEIGGVGQLRTLLLSAATVTANALEQEEKERKELVEVIKANSQDFSDAELEEMAVPTLRKFATALQPKAFVDYGPISPRLNSKGNKDQIAPRPSLLLANRQADPAEKTN